MKFCMAKMSGKNYKISGWGICDNPVESNANDKFGHSQYIGLNTH